MHGYRDKGWINWAHWFGIENAVLGERNDGAELMPFVEARNFARSLKLSGQRAWRRYCTGKMPYLPPRVSGIPAGPEHYYKGVGWQGYGDWLGNGQVAGKQRSYLPYTEARAFVRALGLRSHGEWSRYSRGLLERLSPMPAGIPRNPNQTYAADGFTWGDWLGIELPHRAPRASRFRDFSSARAFAQSLELTSSTHWARYISGEVPEKPPRPADIPRNPKSVYGDSWQGWGDWLGTGTIAPFDKKFRSFEDARGFARTLGLKNGAAWSEWCHIRGNPPQDIPRHPATVYKSQGWISWPDFLQPPTGETTPLLKIAPLT